MQKLSAAKERHQYCPKGSDSWCAYQKDIVSDSEKSTFEDKDHHLDPAFLEFLTPVFERLSEPKLLKRCVPGYSQNANESVNALVWQRCPIHKQKGCISVDTAARGAALAFNEGASGCHDVLEKLSIYPGKAVIAGSKRKDSRRIKTSIQRNTEKFQRARAIMRNAKHRAETKGCRKCHVSPWRFQ